MSKCTDLNNKISGRVGDLVYFVRGGQQIVRSVPASVKNPRTEAQMRQRMKWANVLAVYKALQPCLKGCFEVKAAGQTDYNRFMSTNLQSSPVYLEKGIARMGGCCRGTLCGVARFVARSPGERGDTGYGHRFRHADYWRCHYRARVCPSCGEAQRRFLLRRLHLFSDAQAACGHPRRASLRHPVCGLCLSGPGRHDPAARHRVRRGVQRCRRSFGCGGSSRRGGGGVGAQPHGEWQNACQFAAARGGECLARRVFRFTDVVRGCPFLWWCAAVVSGRSTTLRRGRGCPACLYRTSACR